MSRSSYGSTSVRYRESELHEGTHAKITVVLHTLGIRRAAVKLTQFEIAQPLTRRRIRHHDADITFLYSRLCQQVRMPE